jgi:hypothetical protein
MQPLWSQVWQHPIKKMHVVYSTILIVLVALLVASSLPKMEERKVETTNITLETQHIAILPPHGHTVGRDSLSDHGHHVSAQSIPYITPRDMWVIGMEAKVQGAPSLTLHHGTLFRTDERDLECPTESPRPLVSLAQDQLHTTQMSFEDGYGIFIPEGTPLVLDAMFHNPEPPVGVGGIYENVALQFTLVLAEDTTPSLQPLTYHLLRLSDTPCREYSHSFTVPEKTTGYTFSGTDEVGDASVLSVAATSRIVYWGAHLHGWEGGRQLTVRKNEAVIETFTSNVSVEDPHRFDTPHTETDVVLEVGDTLSIAALYDNPTQNPLRGAMGHLGVYLAPQKDN